MHNLGLYVQALAVSFGLSDIGPASTPEPLASLSVSGDAHYTRPHNIDIYVDAPAGLQGRETSEPRRWRAVRTSDARVDVLTSDECPALVPAVSDFSAFKSEKPDTGRRPPNAPTLPIPPTLKDGFSTIVSYPTSRPDGSMAFVYRSGHAWGHQLVSALLPCWGSLSPTSQ